MAISPKLKPFDRKEATKLVKECVRVTTKDRRYIKRMRKLGASNYEIAKALGIPENSLSLEEI